VTININLLPWREERKVQLKREFFALLGGVGLMSGILLLLIHFFVSNQIKKQTENNQILRDEIKTVDYQIAEIKDLQKEKERLLARMEIIQKLQGNRPNIVRLFDNIVRTMPDGLYLTHVARAGKNILLDGRAESNTRVSKLMRNIEASAWLMAPLLSDIQRDEKPATSAHAVDFHLQAQQRVDEESPFDQEGHNKQ